MPSPQVAEEVPSPQAAVAGKKDCTGPSPVTAGEARVAVCSTFLVAVKASRLAARVSPVKSKAWLRWPSLKHFS